LISIKLLHKKSLEAKVYQKRGPIVEENLEGFGLIFQITFTLLESPAGCNGDGGYFLIGANTEFNAPHEPSDCNFHTRCPQKNEECKTTVPQLTYIGNGHYVACHLGAS